MKSAFYTKPLSVKTSIEIINEARASLKVVETTRPTTPIELSNSERYGTPLPLKSKPRHSPLRNSKLKPLSHDKSSTSSANISTLKKTASLQNLCLNHESDQDRRVHSGPSSKSPVDDIELNSNGNSRETSELHRILQEFVTHAESLLEDESAISSLIETFCSCPPTAEEELTLLRSEFSKKAFGILQNQENLSVKLKLGLMQLIILAGPSSSNMIVICKMIYKTCRSVPRGAMFDKNEKSTLPRVLLIAIGNPKILKRDDYDTLIYCLACIKLISADDKGAGQLLQYDIINAVSNQIFLVLSTVDVSNESDKSLKQDKVSNVCLQLLGILRNISETHAMESFRSANTFAAIFDSMICFRENTDLILMASRVLSKTSLDSECCVSMVEQWQDPTNTTNIFSFLGNILLEHCSNQNITVRMAFAIGNIITDNAEAVPLLTEKGNSALDLYAMLFHIFTKKCFEEADAKEKGVSTECLDVASKTARILANAAADFKVGLALAQCEDFLVSLVQCLFFIENELEKVDSKYQNLIAVVLAALNNISYYALEAEAKHEVLLWTKTADFIHALIPFLMLNHRSSLLLDALHVLANFSRFQEARLILLNFKALDVCLQFLDANSPPLSHVSCGILVNFSIDVQSRQPLLEAGVVKKVHDALLAFANPSYLSVAKERKSFCWPLVDVSCKLLLNLNTTIRQSDMKQELIPTLKKVSNLLAKMPETVHSLNATVSEDVEYILEDLIPTATLRINETVQ